MPIDEQLASFGAFDNAAATGEDMSVPFVGYDGFQEAKLLLPKRWPSLFSYDLWYRDALPFLHFGIQVHQLSPESFGNPFPTRGFSRASHAYYKDGGCCFIGLGGHSLRRVQFFALEASLES